MKTSQLVIVGLVTCLGLSMSACGQENRTPPASGGTGEATSNLDDRVQQRIEDRIRNWFDLYEEGGSTSPALEAFLGHAEVQFRTRDETVRGPEKLRAWPAGLREHFSEIEIEIGPIAITQQGSTSYIARFHVDRRGRDQEGLLHLASTHHRWQIDLDADETPFLVDAEESIVVPHPSTGTKVLCL